MAKSFHSSSSRRPATQSAEVRRYLDGHRSELKLLLGTPSTAGVRLARRHAEIMDGLLVKLYASAHVNRHDSSVLLGAVGGYGRGLLGLKSDLDVCFVTTGATDALQPFVERMLYPLWDAGVSVGHQVISIADAVADAVHDLPMATELLDFRPLVGDEFLAPVLEECAFAGVFSSGQLNNFIARLEAQSEARHQRFGDSVYLLEPDLKNGTGGLRDLDFAMWAARARFRLGSLNELSRLGILTSQQRVETERAMDFLWSARNCLHHLAGRRSDRLTFAEQESVARALGYEERASSHSGGRSKGALDGVMVEIFMSDYYLHARVIARVCEQIFGHAKRRSEVDVALTSALAQGIVSCDKGIALEDPKQLEHDPALALRIYVESMARDLPVLSRSRDAIARASAEPAFCERLRESREAAQAFVQLVATSKPAPNRRDSILSELHDVGLLLAMIPEFLPVVGRVHHDMYHVYTVDVHSVAAVDRLRALSRGDLAREHPLACRLAAEITRPKMLFLATLLHDVGKAIGGKDHARRGAEMSRAILQRLGLSSEDVDDACHLILKHLSMYTIAARRDLSDQATISEFVGEVRGREGLRDLYLLTVADLSTTSPSSMTRWKAGLLDALFCASDALLSGSSVEPRRVANVRNRVKELWVVGDGCALALEEFLDTMPERYLLSNAPEDILEHARVAICPRDQPVAAAFVSTGVPSRGQDVVELCVVTDSRPNARLCVVAADRPGLLASIAAAISANRLEVHAAQVNSRPLRDGGMQAVDLFWVHIPHAEKASVHERLPKLERDLQKVITGQVAPAELLKRPRSVRWCERSSPPVFTEVVIDQRASQKHTVIEVLTQDRPGLLFTLAQELHGLGLSITLAKISTEGTRVIDVFYVTEANGEKVLGAVRSDEIRARLLACLGAAAAVGQA
jgi:[protein-PII] uridylyltransferase